MAKALIALANHGGGYIILGFYEDENKNLIPAENRPTNLNVYCQDRINAVIQRYADPVFHCKCNLVLNPGTRQEYPIIIILGVHRTPIRTKSGSPGTFFKANPLNSG